MTLLMKPIFICGPKYGIYGDIKELTLKTLCAGLVLCPK